MGRPGALAVGLLAAAGLSTVCADLARTGPMSVTDWELESQMQLSVSSAGDVLPLTYNVIPLTADLGLNESQTDQGNIHLEGNLEWANVSTYAKISGSNVIPYLCCDSTVNSFITTDQILNHLMSNDPQPQAILLYSMQGQCCGLAGQNLNFQRLLTMADNNAATELGSIATGTAGVTRASISGNFTNTEQDQQDDQQQGNNSAVAMSILYSITGLITLLFLIIIATGAIRAHRYPERYGPRSGFGGRPRQSRAKGLARAVLETLPIVKFGDGQPAKPDPDAELEDQSRELPKTRDLHHGKSENGSERHLSTIPESPIESTPTVEAMGALRNSDDNSSQSAGEGNSGGNQLNPGAGNEEGLGCSICTEDFTVGEDVRVLPCNHKFHPPCVDPWLTNVSGTCPLCRLDLRPGHEDAGEAADEHPEAPPLGAESTEAGDTSNASRRRSRLFDLSRLRHATVEERLEALRRIRTEQRTVSPTTEEESQGRARLANRLKERFHIRTRVAQRTSEQAGTPSTS